MPPDLDSHTMESLAGTGPAPFSHGHSPDPGQLHRRRQVVALASKFCHRWFDRNGIWIHSAPKPDSRKGIKLCFGLLDGSAADVHLANRILAQLDFTANVATPKAAFEVEAGFDIFVTNHAVQLLVRFGGRLDAEVRGKMEQWARPALQDFPGDRQPDYQFHGVNDNMPAKATLGLVLGGEYFGDRSAVEHGLWNLHQLCDLLARRGLLSEYTSPTYTPLTLHNLSEIAELARNEEARRLASLCVERIWADLIAHFHAPTGLLGGPYSRSYQSDSTGHLSQASFLLWFVRGAGVFPDPIRELSSDPARLITDQLGSHCVPLGQLAWITCHQHTVPRYLRDWEASRRYPFRVVATAEHAGGWPGGEVLSTHYQEESFALGTAFDEQGAKARPCDPFFFQYRRKGPARGPEDVRTVYARYVIDDDGPDGVHRLESSGMLHTLQEGRTALVLSHPVSQLENREVTSLRLAVILSAYSHPIEKLEIIDDHVFFCDGAVQFAFRALNRTNWGGTERVIVTAEGKYQVVSFPNYQGTPWKFQPPELARTLNGFIFFVSSRQEEDFAAFKNRVHAAELVDYFQFGNRTVRLRSGGTLLEMSYCLRNDRVRFATINGKPLSRPIWEADGLPAQHLPFLGQALPSNELRLPFRKLGVSWKPEDPWLISDSRTEAKCNMGAGW